MDMREFKAQYPAYKDIPDSELAHALYTRNYADKMSREEFLSMIVPSKPDVPEMGTGTKALRLAEMGSRGFVESVAETIGAVPDLIGSKFVGPISESMGGPKYEPNALANAIKGTVRDAGKVMSIPLYAAIDAGPTEPTGAAERFAYGAGRGAGDAASFIVPGAATARHVRGFRR